MTADVRSLSARTAVVTGAGRGLGRAISIALSRAGARVILAGRDETALHSVAADLGPTARAVGCDVTSEASVAAFAEQLVGEDVSVLVNNAGIAGPVASLVDIEGSDWDEVFSVNVKGVFLMCRAILPTMIRRGFGDVINVASVTGKRPLARRTPYAASKMAVLGLSATLAHEVGPLGIAVNTLSPGPVVGERMSRNFALEAQRTGTSIGEAEAAFVARSALNRMVTEIEVGAAVVAMLQMPGLCGADIDLSAGMVAR